MCYQPKAYVVECFVIILQQTWLAAVPSFSCIHSNLVLIVTVIGDIKFNIHYLRKIMKISCLICLEVFTEECQLSSTFCGHLFHSNCLEKSLESNNTCPNCRKSLYLAKNQYRVFIKSIYLQYHQKYQKTMFGQRERRSCYNLQRNKDLWNGTN